MSERERRVVVSAGQSNMGIGTDGVTYHEVTVAPLALTPEQLEIAADILGGGVTAEDVARFMLPANAPGRLFAASLIRAEQKAIRDAVQRREWWAKLASIGAAGAGWNVRPPEPAGGTVQGEPWHYEAPKVIHDISALQDHNLERLSVEGIFATARDDEEDLPEWALRDIAAKLDAEDDAEQAWMDEVVKLPGERTYTFPLGEQPYKPNRAERRRLAREERRRA